MEKIYLGEEDKEECKGLSFSSFLAKMKKAQASEERFKSLKLFDESIMNIRKEAIECSMDVDTLDRCKDSVLNKLGVLANLKHKFRQDSDFLETIDSFINQFELLEREIDRYLTRASKTNAKEVSGILSDEEKEKEFSKYFIRSFKEGYNRYNDLKDDLREMKVAKEFGQVALMIYESKVINRTLRPSTFKEWYTIFCDCVGCEQKKYDKNKLRDPGSQIMSKFYYLT